MISGRSFRRGSLWVVLVLALSFAGCDPECDTCTSDDDCESGLVCSNFSDGSRRCGHGTGETTCRVR